MFFFFNFKNAFEFFEIVLAASNAITFQTLRYAETKLLKPGQHVATWFFDRTVK